MSTAPKEVLELVQKFERNIESYRNPAYNETQVRREFIDPLFEILGWDISNKQGFAEAYKEVIHEAAVKIGQATKAPDYAFRIGGTKKFFLEAKKPGVDIKNNPEPAYQLRRYAWSAGLPLSILTDFEEFAVYDCRIKPQKGDKAGTARILYLTYREYETEWEKIAEVFSKQAIQQGSFDRYAVSAKGKRGTLPVDEAFLEEIEEWRSELAHNIARLNPRLKVRELNFAVQRTIDRIIFLRMCEDRGIESYGQLQALLNGENVYSRLRQIFTRADEKYNSGLFHFEKEAGRAEEPDELTPKLKIEDKILKHIIGRLYYPESPYEFSVLSGDILGNVYEQFLGKVIHLTKTHQARIEEKPEVKKAGGVYYTPKYIVDYIVRNTVGKLCEGKTPKQIEKLKILDPACGSGSFLIGAYSYLLDYHRDWYVKNTPSDPSGLVPLGKGDKSAIFQGSGGEWYLTTQKKKEILLNNIYGVDIDSQAVEVTKLNLLLKVLEGETKDTLESQMKLWRHRALPDLGNNIKCGNSLIGPDFYHGKQLSLLDDEEKYKINVFDWKTEFSEIIKQGGFDAVIGNPPYGALFGEKEAEYFQSNFRVFKGARDVYTCFIEKGILLLESAGILSFIVPSAWLGGPDYKKLREFLLRLQIEKIVLLPFDIFRDAYIDTLIFAVSKNTPVSSKKVQTHSFAKKEKLAQIELSEEEYNLVSQDEWANTENKKFILDPSTSHLIKKIRSETPLTFENVVEMKRGVLFDKKILTKKKASKMSCPYFEGDIYRYELNPLMANWVEFGDRMKERPKELKWFEEPRILLRRLVNRRMRLMATFTTDIFITNKNVYSILSKDKTFDLMAILAVLNSKLVSHLYINQVTQAAKDDFPQATIQDVLALPFPSKLRDKSVQSRIKSMAGNILELNEKISKAKTPDDKTRLQRQIETTDREIDRLVYELYGLTEEEIKIVEESAKK